jgi:voltage-gated potassium channel Kch
MQPKIIVCGLGRTGSKIYSLLKQQGAEVVAISHRPVDKAASKQIIVGDPRANTTLIQAGIRQAKTLVLVHDDDALNLAILTQARILNPQIRIINRLLNHTLGDRLDLILPDHFTMSVAAFLPHCLPLQPWATKQLDNYSYLIVLGRSKKKLSMNIIPG